MIVAYARPFVVGREGISFPHRLLQYGPREAELHEHLLVLRKKEYAHSDPSRFKVTPFKGPLIKDIFSIRDVRFTPRQIDTFLVMTEGLQRRIAKRIEDLRAEALQPQEASKSRRRVSYRRRLSINAGVIRNPPDNVPYHAKKKSAVAGQLSFSPCVFLPDVSNGCSPKGMPRGTWRCSARMMPMRASIVGPPCVATRIRSLIAACHFAAV